MADKDKESFAALFEASGRGASPQRRYGVGQQLDVTVVKLGRDAVFVELDGKQEGFIDGKVLKNEAGDLTVKVGSRLTARVAEVGGRAGAIRLEPIFVRPPREELEAIAAATPAAAVAAPAGATVVVGQRVKGAVTAVERYGVFMQIAGADKRTGRGLIPVAELGVPRGADIHKQFPVGKALEAKVIAIDERGRIRLSIAQLAVDEERLAFDAFTGKKGDKEGPARGFGTLGDLLKKR